MSVSDSNCYQTTVLVAIHPPILLTSNNEFICPNDSVDLGVTVLGGNGGPYNYVWTDGGDLQLVH